MTISQLESYTNALKDLTEKKAFVRARKAAAGKLAGPEIQKLTPWEKDIALLLVRVGKITNEEIHSNKSTIRSSPPMVLNS